jgi:hypothetical protein
MNTETVSIQLLLKMAALLRTTLDALANQERPSFYTLEQGTQAVLTWLARIARCCYVCGIRR